MRLAAAIVAFLLYAGARGVRQNTPNYEEYQAVLGAFLGAFLIHLVAASIVLAVFFRFRATRLPNLVELANPEYRIERSLPGGVAQLTADAQALRSRYLRVCVAAGLLILLLLVWLLGGATFLGPEARIIATRRYSLADVTFYVILAFAIPAAAYGIYKERSAATASADVLALLYSMAFPLGACLAIYTWWVSRSIREIRRSPLENGTAHATALSSRDDG